MAAAERMIDFLRKFFEVKMLDRIWALSCRTDFPEKFRKKAGGAFIDFPRFAYAHYVHVYKFQISKFKSSVFVA